MPRLTKEQENLIEKLRILHPRWSLRMIGREVGTSHQTVKNYLAGLQTNHDALVQYDAKKQTKELTTALQQTIEQDYEKLRVIGWNIIDAILKGDFDEDISLSTWVKEQRETLKAMADLLKKAVPLIDQRQVHVTLNQDAIGDRLWAFLETRGLLQEALEYCSKGRNRA